MDFVFKVIKHRIKLRKEENLTFMNVIITVIH